MILVLITNQLLAQVLLIQLLQMKCVIQFISSDFYLSTHSHSLIYNDNINESKYLFKTENSKEAYKPSHDIINLIFDFENDKIVIDIDNKYLDAFPLNGYKPILFGGPFFDNGTAIVIEKCHFYNR